MVIDEVCRTLIATSLAIILFSNKTFLSHHLLNEMEKVLWNFSKVKN